MRRAELVGEPARLRRSCYGGDASLPQQGEALGIVGPNGAGKTTTLNMLAGDIPPTSGRVLFRGRDVTSLKSHQRCRLGLGRTAQVPRPFEGLTVFENVMVGAAFGGAHRGQAAADACVRALRRADMVHRANTRAGDLTLLDRKRLELAKALATRPRVLLLDEIAGGLTDHEAQALDATLRAIRAEGVSIVWIEHVVHALLSVVDRLAVIDSGALLREGEPAEVLAAREVREVYMGLPA